MSCSESEEDEYVYKGEPKLKTLPKSNGRMITILNVAACVAAITAGVVAIAIRMKDCREYSVYSLEMSILGASFLPFQVVAENGDIEPIRKPDDAGKCWHAAAPIMAYKKNCSKDEFMCGIQQLMEFFNMKLHEIAKHNVLILSRADDCIIVKKLQAKKILPRKEGEPAHFETIAFPMEEFKGKPGKLIYRVGEVRIENDEINLTSQIFWAWELNRTTKYLTTEERGESKKRRLCDDAEAQNDTKTQNESNLADGVSTQVENV